jgi:hypothetical protein
VWRIFYSLLIPLAPLAEQHRIVAKVDELMALCDRLEAQLTTAKSQSRRLLEAVLVFQVGSPINALSHFTPTLLLMSLRLTTDSRAGN